MKKKMGKSIAMFFPFFIFFICAEAQHPYYHHSSRTTSAERVSGQGNNIDVVYHRFTWRIHPDSPNVTTPAKYLKGNVATYFVTKEDNVSAVTFDFNNVHTIDSIKYQGTNLPVANIIWNTAKILQIIFPSPIAATGTMDSVIIYYRGTPPAISGNQYGYQKAKSGSNNYVFTLSESYEDRDWWPCKHDMTDKIDSIDIAVSVPSAFWVASNGKMLDSALSGANRIFKFRHRYPIASYLVSLSIARYRVYHRGSVNIGGTNVPVVYNLFTGKTNSTYNNILNAMDKSKLELVQFSNKYGDYPFKNDKHGFYEFGFSGGMEHQTFSGMGGGGLTSWSIIAHELAHQWFGDKVTCATWSDLWLNEGFARYNEVVAAELVSGLGNPVTHRGSIKTIARNNTTTPIFISNISSSNTIWTSSNVSAIYERAAMVISQLRKLLGDIKFFQACRNYMDDPAITYGGAATADAQRNFEAQFGVDMGAYFNAWIYGFGTPSYAVNWNNSGTAITIQLNQSRSAGASVTHFPMPVVLRVANAANTSNTTLVLYDRGDSVFVAGDGQGAGEPGNTIHLNLAFTPATLTFDPNNETMATGTVTKVSTLREAMTAPDWTLGSFKIYPNPASAEINIVRSGLMAGEGLLLINDLSGKQLLEKNIHAAAEKLNLSNLPAGIYIVKLIQKGMVVSSQKLILQK